MSPFLNYSFLNDSPHFFFTGKGGVVKHRWPVPVRLAALCDSGKRVRLVSTDPASNVGQVFDTQMGNQIHPDPASRWLSALEIDPQAAAQAYRERIVGQCAASCPKARYAVLKNSSRCLQSTEIAALTSSLRS